MSYIGKKISVTTVSGNQYDGILTVINPAEAKIELQMVKLVAVNGRPATQPRSFEYIVFNSDDIRDLYVYEDTPMAASMEGQKDEPINDPAIISQVPAKPLNSDAKVQERNESQVPAKTHLPTNNTMATKDLPMMTRDIQFGGHQPTYSNAISFGIVDEPASAEKSSKKIETTKNNLVVNSETIRSAHNEPRGTVAPTFSPSDSQNTGEGRPRKVLTFPGRPSSSQTPRNTKERQFGAHRQETFGREYDFTRMNAAFDKEQIAAQVAPVVSSDGPCYDKTTSFFDNISSEGKNGDEKTRNERSWNVETFGQAYVSHGHHRRHGGGQRGRGQRKYHEIRPHATGTF